MIREAVVLVGGFGTRLRSIVKDVPKPMALIQDKPFLEYLLLYLKVQGVQKVILSVGYQLSLRDQYCFSEVDILHYNISSICLTSTHS